MAEGHDILIELNIIQIHFVINKIVHENELRKMVQEAYPPT